METTTIVFIALGVIALVCLVRMAVLKRQRDEAVAALDEEGENESGHTVGEHLDFLDSENEDRKHELGHLSQAILALEKQANHFAKVQMLILKQLNVEYVNLPARDALLPLENLPDNKKSKERPA